MKKSLLFLVAVAFALNASAQFNAAEKTVQPKAISSQDRLAAAQVVAGQKKARKSPANGVQYARPAGTFFDNWSKEGSGYYASFLVVPPLTDISFADISTAEGDRVWTINGNEYPAEEDGSFDFGSLPAHDASTGDGPDTYYIPTLTIGETAFALQGAGSGKSSSYGTYASYLAVDTLTTISLYDCHNINYYGWGALSPTPYLYGTGTVAGNKCFGVVQDFPKPAAPLYIEDAFIQCLSNLEQPIPEGKELTLLFVELDENGNETDNVLAELTAGPTSFEDWQQDLTDDNFTSGTGYTGIIVFQQKSVDIFGQETVQPVIVNTPFRVYLTGLDQDGIDLGFFGRLMGDESDLMDDSSFLVADASGNISSRHYTSNAISLPIVFTAMYDVAVLQDSDTGEYEAPAEGGTVTRKDAPDYDAAYIYTAYPWYDDQANENYFVYVEYPDGDPEWLTTDVYTDYWADYNVTLLGLESEALPSDVEGRQATVYVFGPAAEVSFTVTQGVVTDVKGVEVKGETKANNAVYNLAGQKVDAAFKGIVIENGKKVVKK